MGGKSWAVDVTVRIPVDTLAGNCNVLEKSAVCVRVPLQLELAFDEVRDLVFVRLRDPVREVVVVAGRSTTAPFPPGSVLK